MTFTREQLEEWSTRGQWMIPAGKNIIPLAAVAPDLALTNADAMQIDVEKDVVLGDQLGEGAFATVFKGTMNGSEQVAVKRLNMKGKDDIQAKKIFGEFRREVLTMSALHHPCVVNLKAFSLQSPYSIIMEYVPHGSLYGFIKDRKDNGSALGWSARLRIAYDIAAGMAHLHSIDPPLIHKDLKSPNILMAAMDESAPAMAKIADFGISGKLYMSMFSAKKARDREVENPTWLAPEIIREEPYSAASDVYPFGIMLWELLTLQHPYEEFNFSFNSDLEDAIKKGRRPTVPADCPLIYKDILTACWHDEPAKRPTFAEIVNNLLPGVIAELAPELGQTLARVQQVHAAMDEERRVARENLRRQREERRKVQLEEDKKRKEDEQRELFRMLQEKDSLGSTLLLGGLGEGDDARPDLDMAVRSPMSGVAAAAAGAAKTGAWRHTLHVGAGERAALSATTFAPPAPAGPSAVAAAMGASATNPAALTQSTPSALPLQALGNPPQRSPSSTNANRIRTSVQVSVTIEMLESSPYNKLTPADLKILIVNRGMTPPGDKEDKDNFVLQLVRDDAMLKGSRARRVSDADGESATADGATSPSAQFAPPTGASTTPPPQQPSTPPMSAPPKMSLPAIPPPKGDPNGSPGTSKRPPGRTPAASVAVYGTIRTPSQPKLDPSSALASLNLAPMPKMPAVLPPVSSSPPLNASGETTPTSARATSPIAQHAHVAHQQQQSQSLGAPQADQGQSVSPRPMPAGGPPKVPFGAAPGPGLKLPSIPGAGPPQQPVPASPGAPKMAMLGVGAGPATGSGFAPLGAPGQNAAAMSRNRPQSMALPQAGTAKPPLGLPPKQPAPATPQAGAAAPAANPAAILAPVLPDGTPVAGLPLSKEGEWSLAAGTAGGSPMSTTWRRCPQFQLQVLQGGGNSRVKISLTQPEQATLPFIGFYIFVGAPDGKKKIDLQNAIVYQPQHFMNKTSVEAVVELKEGPYMIMPSIYHPNMEGKFKLTVQGDRTRLLPAIEWYGSAEAPGEWNAEKSGGCMNNPTWKQNPYFKLTVGGNGKVFVTLTPDRRDVGMGFYVFGANPTEPLAKSMFTMVTVLRELTLPPGEYTVLPTTFQANIAGSFVVAAYGDVPVALAPL